MGPVVPFNPTGPCDPGGPACPLSPDAPVAPIAPLSPVAPLEPLGPVETDFDVRLTLGDSPRTVGSFSFIELVILEEGVLNLTSKTECNEENKSVTIIQIVSSSSIDEGIGF